VVVTPPPDAKETLGQIKDRETKKTESLIRAMQKQRTLGANQLRGDGAGIRLY
jgi:hypothetical protein